MDLDTALGVQLHATVFTNAVLLGIVGFDNPWFLPVLLWLFVGWFGWDIVTNAEAYQKYPNFNRGGLVISGLLALYYSWTAARDTFLAPKDDDGK